MLAVNVTICAAIFGGFGLLGIAIALLTIGTEHGINEIDATFFASGIVVIVFAVLALFYVVSFAMEVKDGKWEQVEERRDENPRQIHE